MVGISLLEYIERKEGVSLDAERTLNFLFDGAFRGYV